MFRQGALGLVAIACSLACGCSTTAVTDAPPAPISQAPLTNDASAFTYQLTDEELKYDCKKLTGQMQVRILQLRGYESREKTTLASRGLQTVAKPIWGGTSAGLDPDGQYRKDHAMLEAYNRQLAAKKCKTFDIEAELKSTDTNGTPAPVDPKKKPAAAPAAPPAAPTPKP